MRRPGLLTAAWAVVAAGALGACTAEERAQSDDVAPSQDTVRAGLVALYAGPDPTYAATTGGQCFADRLLDRLSLEDLVEAGVVGDDGQVPPLAPMLDVDVAGAWVDAAGSCEPYAVVSARALAARSDVPLDQAAYAACLRRAIAPDRTREALVAALSGDYADAPAVAELRSAEATCTDRVARP